MTSAKVCVAMLPLASIILVGATSPVLPPVATAMLPGPATLQLSKPHYLEITPFRDGLGTVESEADTYKWAAIGGPGPLDDRRRRLLGALAGAHSDTRQKARFDYARFLVITGRAIEGSAVLDAMREDEPQLADSAPFQAVRAVALIRAGQFKDGLDALDLPALVSDSNACLWRSYAHAKTDNPQAAILNWPCAISAINRKNANERRTFALAIVRAAYMTGNDALAANILARLPSDFPEVMFWTGLYAFKHGQNDIGTKLLTKVKTSGNTLLASRAELELVNSQKHLGTITTAVAIARLDKLRFTWRGGPFEADLLQAISHYEESRGNIRGALAAEAPLIRYFDISSVTSADITRGQQLVQAALDPASHLTLSDQAGIYWDYRDLAPQGADGDDIIRRLAEEMAAAGLPKRAADLLQRQIESRLTDAAPAVAVRVAEWRLLSGQPDKALQILQGTNDGVIPGDVRQQRQLLFVYSLLSLNRGAEAIALLDDNSSGLSDKVRAELYWQGREWTKFMALNGPMIASHGNELDNDARAMIVRQAIAAAIAHNAPELQRLSSRYGVQFAAQDSYLGAAFRLLAGGTRIDGASMQKAMADIDKAAPADAVLGWVTALSQTIAQRKSS